MSEALVTVLDHARGFFQHLHDIGLIAYDDFQAFVAAYETFKNEQGGTPVAPAASDSPAPDASPSENASA